MMQYDRSATQDSWVRPAMFAKDKRKHWSQWQNHYETKERNLKLNEFGFSPQLPEIAQLPQYSFMLRFTLKLQKPYISKEVNDRIELAIRAYLPELKPSKPEKTVPEIERPRYLVAPGQIDPDFLHSDGRFKSKEQYLEGKYAKKAGQLYDKAKKWWKSEQLRLAEAATVDAIPKPETLPKITMTDVTFDKLSDLGDRAQAVGQNLAKIMSKEETQ